MTQHLIVEGKDYHFIGALCSHHFPRPSGFSEKTEKQFLRGGGGYTETLNTFIDAFDNIELTNIGLIVDADFGALDARFSAIIAALSKRLNHDLSKYTLNTEGVTIVEKDLPTIGIWLMPDNTHNGYLEYFIEQLIEKEDDMLALAKSTVEEIMKQKYCRFTDLKKQKALIHSWLAWQETPGLPFGTALKAGYLNPQKDTLQPFLNWVGRSFQF